jgi:hypothetical protein
VGQHHQKLSAYERELNGLVKTIRHWRSYIWSCAFTVRTSHYSLKFQLDHRPNSLSTIPQQAWVSKLFGYDLTVEYRPNRLNGAIDALLCCEEDIAAVHAISARTFVLFDKLRVEAQADPEIAPIRAQLEGGAAPDGWSQADGLVLFWGKIFIPEAFELWPELLSQAHTSHEGVQKMVTRWQSSCYSP